MDTNEISDHLISYIRTDLKDAEYGSGLEQLQGGYETATYRFRLKGVGDELSRHLVLRLYPPSYGTRNAIWESTVQNALAAEGFPVAKVHFACTDMTFLGGAFIVMDYIPGQQLLHASPQKMPEVLGETHAALHLIDPGPLIKTLKEKGIDEYEFGLDSRYDWLKTIAGELPWMSDGVSWLIDNRPPETERLAI
jgi:aminoglycoside phosphotransferase (APT) family kinase protein